MPGWLESAAMAQGGLTALSGGYNALFFLRYRSPLRGRRLGARVLALVNLALLLWGLRPWLAPGGPGLDLVVGVVPLVAAGAISALILRSRRRPGRR